MIDSVVALVLVIVPVTVASPVAPANSPIPPVNTKLSVNVAVPSPLAVLLPELVPSRVPRAKVSVNDPSEKVMLGGLLKSTVEVDCGVTAPNIVSSPLPVKFWTKMPGVPVGVSVESPVKVPVIIDAWLGIAPISTSNPTRPNNFAFMPKPSSQRPATFPLSYLSEALHRAYRQQVFRRAPLYRKTASRRSLRNSVR